MNRAIIGVVGAMVTAMLLTSCSPQPPVPAVSMKSSSTPTSQPINPTSAATCQTVFTAEEYSSLEADGFSLNPDIFVLDDEMQSVMDDGFGCYWTRGGGDVRVWFAQGVQTSKEWDVTKQQLLGSGWTEVSDPVDGSIQASTHPDNNEIPAMTHRAGVTYYASYSGLLGSVDALQG
jgi:hypothetical protein